MKEIIKAPLPGRVIEVNITVGDAIDEEALICTIEAMKMENPILCPVKGLVTELAVSPGQLVRTGEKIAVIEY